MLTFSLLFVSGWMSESHTVEVQSGEVVDRTEPSCISSTYYADDTPSFCNGFQNGKFEMTSNVTTVFLKIKQVNLSDTGMYFFWPTTDCLQHGMRLTNRGRTSAICNLRSNDLNSAVLRTLPKAMRNRRPALEREVETCVIHTASR
uniref:Immunoglobulin V-set domain-containing protein n=1 Tax=Amphiprion ocellaris TaxID=80972 RepID=A0AAQ5XI70_AMPOC